MIKDRFLISILGLACAVVPARAGLSYQSTSSSFSNQATVTDGLLVSSLITFSAADLTTDGFAANDEYIDITDGIEFFAFNSNGTTHESFTVSGGALHTASGSGDSIEIVFTSPIDGLGLNLTTGWSSGDNVCEGTSVTDCSGNVFISQNGSGFMGALNDNPGPASALPTLWLHVLSGSADTDIQSFEFADPAPVPEIRTMLTLGFGLVALGLLRSRRKNAVS